MHKPLQTPPFAITGGREGVLARGRECGRVEGSLLAASACSEVTGKIYYAKQNVLMY